MSSIASATSVPTAGELAKIYEPSAWKSVRRFLRTKPLGTFGAAIVLVFMLLALLALLGVMPYPYDEGQGIDRLKGPSAAHWLGTDNLGRDMFSRIEYGAWISVRVGFGAVFVGTGIATLIGLLSGYVGGRFDLLVQRLIDIWIAFPPLVLLITIVTIFTSVNTDPEVSIFIVAATIGSLTAAGASRVVRSAVLTIRHQPYMEAAHSAGCGDWRIIFRYVLPNVFAPIIILATTQLGGAILIESTLSFLGFGVRPPMPAWGSMLSGSGRQFFLASPMLAIWPGLAISLLVFGFNMFGDALRDVLDPRLRGGR